MITKAVADLTDPAVPIILIEGEDLPEPPAVFLGEDTGAFVELTVLFATDTSITAELPVGIESANYLLVVEPESGNGNMDLMALTIGPDITGVEAGPGLLGGGVAGDVTVEVDFDGTGNVDAAARSDHDHRGQDIARGTVAETFIDQAITRDPEVFGLVTTADGPGSGLDADTLDGFDSSAFLTSVADLWVNTTGDTMNGTLVLNPAAGNSLEVTTDIDLGGNILKGGQAFIQHVGPNNTSLGLRALESLTTGANNTSLGFHALVGLTTGAGNTAVGKDALASTTDRFNNTAIGAAALIRNIDGDNKHRGRSRFFTIRPQWQK